MKKQLNVSGVVNELRGGSLFFRADHSPQKSSEMSLHSNESRLKDADEPMSEPTNTQTSERANERMSEPTKAHGYRIVRRLNADLFLDQLDFIEEWARKQRRKSGKHVTKGEVLREMVDFFIEKNG
jgi:hypothetical protein